MVYKLGFFFSIYCQEQVSGFFYVQLNITSPRCNSVTGIGERNKQHSEQNKHNINRILSLKTHIQVSVRSNLMLRSHQLATSYLRHLWFVSCGCVAIITLVVCTVHYVLVRKRHSTAVKANQAWVDQQKQANCISYVHSLEL